jgi:signal transduction histidine kinase
VRVTDDGDGVTEELRERIFTPFFSTRPKGTGLGLTVVRRCADAHGGDVILRKTSDRGASFELHLPRLDAD